MRPFQRILTASPNSWKHLRIALAGMAAACFAGCGGQPTAKYIPTADKAHAVLTEVLEAWKAGTTEAAIATASGKVNIADTSRKPGQRLVAYDILGETPNEGGPRAFTVALTLANPDQNIKERYLVVGIDPPWVFRQTDYELLSHWDHPMPGSHTNAVPEAR